MPNSPVMRISLGETPKRTTMTDSKREGASTACTENEIVRCEQPEIILTAVADPHSRTILSTAAETAQSVPDIVTTSQMATATAYRKVQRLTDAGLLRERIRITQDGPNVMEYQLAVDELRVTLDGDGNPSVSLITRPAIAQPQSKQTEGKTNTENESEEVSAVSSPENSLQELFTEVTGQTVLTHPQETTPSHAIDESRPSLMAEQEPIDGLADTYPDMDANEYY